MDAAGHSVRLTSVNWYGFDQKEFVVGGLDHAPLATIVSEIVALGVNSVRLPWANETLEHNPVVADYAVKANPQFKGKRAMEIMDAVVAALAKAHIMVILDNHMSRADWCCRREGWKRTLVQRRVSGEQLAGGLADDRRPLPARALGDWR